MVFDKFSRDLRHSRRSDVAESVQRTVPLPAILTAVLSSAITVTHRDSSQKQDPCASAISQYFLDKLSTRTDE